MLDDKGRRALIEDLQFAEELFVHIVVGRPSYHLVHHQ